MDRSKLSDRFHRFVERAVDGDAEQRDDVWGKAPSNEEEEAELLREPLDFESADRPRVVDNEDDWRRRADRTRDTDGRRFDDHGRRPDDSAIAIRDPFIPIPNAAPPIGVAAPPPRSGPQVDDVLNTLWRRKWLIAAIIVPITMLALFYVLQTPSRYSATALIGVESNTTSIHGFESFFNEFAGGDAALQAELETLRSRRMLDKVIDGMQLRLAEKERAERPQAGAFANFIWAAGDTLESSLSALKMRLKGEEPPSTEEEVRAAERLELIEFLRAHLSIAQRPRTQMITIRFTSEDPEMAARLANRYADTYIEDQIARKSSSTTRATQVLQRQVEEQREKVRIAEVNVDEKRKTLGLLEGEKGVLNEQQVSELSSELVLARSKRAEAEARLRQMESLARGSSGDSVFAGFDTPLLDDLRQRKAELRLQKQDFERRFNPQHPDVEQVNEELRALQRQIASELDKIVGRAQNEFNVAAAREASLKESMDTISSDISQSNTGEVELRALEREAESGRVLLNDLLTRLNQAASQDDIDVQEPDARIIAAAVAPSNPSFPNKKLILAVAVMGATLAGIALALALDITDRSYRSGEQIREATGLRTLALIPMLRGFGFRQLPHRHLAKHRSSQFAESLRNLSASIRFSRQDQSPRVVLVTSAHPKEGKSTVSLCLAQEYAMAGHRTVLIDGDLRRPSVHQSLGINKQPGLVDVLQADARLNEVLVYDEASNLYVLPSGNTRGAPPDILGSARMQKLIGGLPKWFDYIVIDSPPVMAVSDARLLVREADTTVFVVRWGKTRRASVDNALRQVLDCGGHLAGVVLSMVDGKRHAKYGYTDSDYFSANVRRYYAS